MEKHFYLPFFFLFMLILTFNSGGILKLVNADQQRTWCVARPSADPIALQDNLNWICSQMDCGVMKEPGSPCYDPNNLISHASVAMNLYYQSHGRDWSTCKFKNSGLIVQTDPSYGSCKYE